MKHAILIVLVVSVFLCVATLMVGSSSSAAAILALGDSSPTLDDSSSSIATTIDTTTIDTTTIDTTTTTDQQQQQQQQIATVPPQKMATPRTSDVDNTNTNIRPISSTVVIMVLSARGNFDRRAAIRETWGTDAVYFVVGSRCNVPRAGKHSGCGEGSDGTTVVNTNSTFQTQLDLEDELLTNERDKYRDILMSSVPESYLSLTNKLKVAYRFALLTGQGNVEWIIKADDDFYVSVRRLQTFVSQYNSSALHVIGCLVWCCAPVRPAGKNADTVYQNGKGNYPWFPRGSCGHGVSAALARKLVFDANLNEYPGEDTSLGIWIQQSAFRNDVVWIKAHEIDGVKRWHFNKVKDAEGGHGGRQWLDAEPRFSSNDYCDNTQFLIMGHDITPDKMRECHDIRKVNGTQW